MDLTPEAIQTLMQIGGVPAVILFGVFKMWNGTTKRVTEIAEDTKEIRTEVGGVKERLIKLETRFEDSGKRRRASDHGGE